MGQIKHIREVRKNEGGFGFAQLMIILPIILIIMGSAASYFYQKMITNIQIRARDNFKIHMQNMQTDLENPMVWDEILRSNGGFNCLIENTCKSVSKSEFYVMGVDGKFLSGPNSLGFSLDGTPCKESSENCPIKWKFEWRPMCSVAETCPSDTEVEFYGQLVEGDIIKSPLNLDKYKVVLYRKIF